MEEKVSFRVTAEQKNRLMRLADLTNKSLSDYARDAALSFSTNCDSDFAKIEKITNDILADIIYIKKFQYVVTRLALFIVNEYTKDSKKTMEYFHEILADANEKFDEKGE
ncbi:hypothetical protein SAMN05660235_01157 [Sporolituus thermophilus DSM 23256]|uniref:Uncharacterized protein n=2 Tax=Sporolituus TaxID=909931 RepID=A0A1G7K3E1_9FIRM|nr:hypothetical protein SAMN05660235_01157 [Sporolituus thermophilus DSM 23256]